MRPVRRLMRGWSTSRPQARALLDHRQPGGRQPRDHRTADRRESGVNNPFVGFVPWIIFWVVAGPSTWEYATLGALLAAVILAVPDAEHHSLKLLDVTTIAFFAVLSVLAVVLDASDLRWLEDYSQAISSGV